MKDTNDEVFSRAQTHVSRFVEILLQTQPFPYRNRDGKVNNEILHWGPRRDRL